jgi:hypothetical protein
MQCETFSKLHTVKDRCSVFFVFRKICSPELQVPMLYLISFLYTLMSLIISVADPELFYPLDTGSGSGMNFFRISDPGSGPFLVKFIYIIFRILAMLSFLNWATLKTYWYSRNRKQQEKGMLTLATPFFSVHRS